MTELLELVASWESLLAVVVIFGFAPGFVLRLILRLYPHDDPRRQELLAELYAMPRMWRPVWVAQQIETALFEGPPSRRRARRRQASARRQGTQRYGHTRRGNPQEFPDEHVITEGVIRLVLEEKDKSARFFTKNPHLHKAFRAAGIEGHALSGKGWSNGRQYTFAEMRRLQHHLGQPPYEKG